MAGAGFAALAGALEAALVAWLVPTVPVLAAGVAGFLAAADDVAGLAAGFDGVDEPPAGVLAGAPPDGLVGVFVAGGLVAGAFVAGDFFDGSLSTILILFIPSWTDQ